MVAELYGVRVGVVLWHGTRLHGTTNDLKDDVASQKDECCFPQQCIRLGRSFVLHVGGGRGVCLCWLYVHLQRALWGF